MPEDKKRARLNMMRFGLLLLVVLAMTVAPASMYLVAAPLGEPVSVVGPTVITTVLVALIAVGVYFGYRSYLDRA